MVNINSFLFYDLVFLVMFTLWVVWFLYTRKHNLKREGIIYLYRTQLGVKFINYIGKKFRKTIKVAQYFSVSIGLILMGSILFLLAFTLYTYIRFPQITQIVKAPPLLPLIPYFPSIFGLESFFPPLYFTYWIIAILIVAVVHEFSHGIFAKFHNLNIKSTGFAFLGPILGAFVEPDEVEMNKRGKFAQMSILSAGVFANILTAIIFFFIMWGIFASAFSPAGVLIHSYPIGEVEINTIQSVNGFQFTGDFEGFLDNEMIEITTQDLNYVIPKDILESQLKTIGGGDKLNLYIDAPAIRNGVFGSISKFDGTEIKSLNDLNIVASSKKPGDDVVIETISAEGVKTYELTLAENPRDPGKAFLGINLNVNNAGGLRKLITNALVFKDPIIYYEETNKPLVFIYYLIWWIVIINFFVALFNMLPIGILDGGRFFYLTVLGLSGSERATKIFYKILFYIIMLIFIGLLFSWLIAI